MCVSSEKIYPLRIVPRFLFHTCIGSGPDSPCRAKCEDLGVEALLPLAVLATSRGLGAGGMVLPAAAGFVAIYDQLSLLMQSGRALPLSALVLAEIAVGVPALARKFLVTDTALNVVGFLTELERAWCGLWDSSLPAASDFKGPPVSVSEPALPSTAICSAGPSAVSCSCTWSTDDIRICGAAMSESADG